MSLSPVSSSATRIVGRPSRFSNETIACQYRVLPKSKEARCAAKIGGGCHFKVGNSGEVGTSSSSQLAGRRRLGLGARDRAATPASAFAVVMEVELAVRRLVLEQRLSVAPHPVRRLTGPEPGGCCSGCAVHRDERARGEAIG